MKLLFDQNLSFKLCQRFSDLFPNSSHVGMVGLERADDRAVWAYAAANDFVLVSRDADFAEMAAVYGPPPKLIWLRSGNPKTATIEAVLREHYKSMTFFVEDPLATCLELY